MTQADHQSTSLRDRVSWNQLIAYGMGGLIPIALFNIAGQLMGLLGNISLGLSAFWLGTIMIIPRLWDAVSDPVMGHITDTTRTRWGRRRPFILIGGIAVAVSFVAMWWVPRGDAIRDAFGSEESYNWFQLAYILAGLLIFFTACTVFEIPHGALGMEMSRDYHERTRLFSAKSFLGNLFAMGTPWLIALAGLEIFSGVGGDLIDGMRYVSLFIAAAMIPLAVWWFTTLREPALVATQQQEKTSFIQNMRTTATNGTFIRLVIIIFTLAMGFNFVGLFNYYITIFYLYGGDTSAAGTLLGVNGTIWAITGLLAVFPLNWISRNIGKNKTLLIAILLMCAAQLSKIVCYNPALPYLVIIPTVLLSAGMLMFFTLGASMVGDVCDEDELKTGTRSEGSYYAVYWWFIKMGTAFASFVTGVLLLYTHFDERQNVLATSVRGHVAVVQAEIEKWADEEAEPTENLPQQIDEELAAAQEDLAKYRDHLDTVAHKPDRDAEQTTLLAAQAAALETQIAQFQEQFEQLQNQSVLAEKERDPLQTASTNLLASATGLKKQSPKTLFRLRFVEIGLPLLLSIISIWLTLRYPLTEARCYEIKAALQQRRDAHEANN